MKGLVVFSPELEAVADGCAFGACFMPLCPICLDLEREELGELEAIRSDQQDSWTLDGRVLPIIEAAGS